MKYVWNVLIYKSCRNLFIQETRRYAGHSKWQNIKAGKQAQDAQRSQIFGRLANRMKAAVIEAGNSDPTLNLTLGRLIAQAKKVNMPSATLKAILTRIQNTNIVNEPQVLMARSPAGVILIIYVMTENINRVKFLVQQILKKFNCKVIDHQALNMFDCASYIIASKDCNLDQAMEDAIKADAEDVQEIEDDDCTCFKFRGKFLCPEKVTTQLKNLGYTILSTENMCIPTSMVELTKEGLENMEKLKQKLTSEIKEIEKIEDNIELS